MSLSELAAAERTAGINSVLRGLNANRAAKVFLAADADAELLREIVELAEKQRVPVEWAGDSQQLGRACAVTRKTAAAALLKK